MKLASPTEVTEALKIANEWWNDTGKIMWSDSGYAARSAVMEFVLNQMGLTAYRSIADEE